LLLVMSLALYFAVSTGLWDATTNPTVDEKKPAPSACQPEPQQVILVHARPTVYCQAPPVQSTNPEIVGVQIKLMAGEVRFHERRVESRTPYSSRTQHSLG
jgi:hypothetical protein